MGLYKKKYNNQTDLHQKIAALKEKINESGWPSPLIIQKNKSHSPTNEEEVTPTPPAGQNIFSQLNISPSKIISLAVPLLLNPSTLGFILGKFSKKKNTEQPQTTQTNSAAISGIMQSMWPLLTPLLSTGKKNNLPQIVGNILGGYAKWTVLSWGVHTIFSWLKKKNKRRNNPAQKALRQLEKEQKKLIRVARQYKKQVEEKTKEA